LGEDLVAGRLLLVTGWQNFVAHKNNYAATFYIKISEGFKKEQQQTLV
jgi:hypothetical protein